MMRHGRERSLNRLIRGCEDDARTYEGAARALVGLDYRPRLLALARRRRVFAAALAPFVRRLGHVARRGGSTGATLRLAFFRIRDFAAGGGNDGDSFHQCARAEAHVESLYLNALRNSWDADVCAALC